MNIQLLNDEEVSQVIGGEAIVDLRQLDADPGPDHLTVFVISDGGLRLRLAVDSDIGDPARI